MRIINSKEEYEHFYPYDKKWIKTYPEEYPCVMKIEFEERGIMGDERVIYVAYYPKDVEGIDLFLEGLDYEWKMLK